MRTFIISIVLVVAMSGQAPPISLHKPGASVKSGIDTVIELVQGGMSEFLVIKILRGQDVAYTLSPADVLKLQKAGVTENIISVMIDPKAAVTQPLASSPAPPSAGATSVPSVTAAAKDPSPGSTNSTATAQPADLAPVTPFPPNLQIGPAARKRRLVVDAFGYGAVKSWVQAWFNTDANIGEGIRAMLTSQLQDSKDISLLERGRLDVITNERQLGNTNVIDQSTKARSGRILGADCILVGDVTIFGRDDKTKKKGGLLGGLAFIPHAGIVGGLAGVQLLDKNEKAVVGIAFRIVDAETSEVIWAGQARGESSRSSKDVNGLGGVLGGVGGAAAGFANSMDSTNFQKTIIGEATGNAVKDIARQLEERISQIPAKARNIIGRVANTTPSGTYLALGAIDGVLVGDRFEIRRIDNEVLDPQTKEPIDVEAVKVGELVVSEVHDHAAIGNYGGQQLSAVQLTGRGYQARLVSK